MRRARLIIIALLLLVLTTSVTVSAKTITLKFRDLFTGADSDVMTEMVNTFNETHPEIRVERESTKWENYYDQLQLAIAGGDAPDIAVVHTRWLPAFAARKALFPLDTYIENSGLLRDDFVERAWDGSFYEGHQYGVPLDVIVAVVLFYNRDLMTQAGITEVPQTGEELIYASQKIKEVTGKWGITVPLTGYTAFRNFFTTLHQLDASIVTEDGKKANFNNEAGKRALGYWHDFVYKYEVAPDNVAQPLELFRLGESGFLLEGIWNNEAFKNQEDLNYGVAMVPKMFNNRSFFGNSHNFVVPRQRKQDTENVQAALVFMKWMAENADQWAQVPAVKSVLYSDVVQKSVRGNVMEQLPDLVYPPALVDIGRVENAVQEAVELALAGSVTVEQALQIAEDQVNSVLSR